eukprot:TRINITY_DN9584_c0_g1_i1.p1 TRINITY_DN9584_c0_g1~~TRINITY_DN9584_c0_g1_i1.p1  ORF type:complete len:273 (-),score=54.49 TRINITY_DN9584_c0_g1_i1:97-915(-)
MELNLQVLNGCFVLSALYNHPRHILNSHYYTTRNWPRIAYTYAWANDRNWLKTGTLIFVGHIGCFATYPICFVRWGYALNHYNRPSFVVPFFLPLVLATDIAGGIGEAIFRHQEQERDRVERLTKKLTMNLGLGLPNFNKSADDNLDSCSSTKYNRSTIMSSLYPPTTTTTTTTTTTVTTLSSLSTVGLSQNSSLMTTPHPIPISPPHANYVSIPSINTLNPSPTYTATTTTAAAAATTNKNKTKNKQTTNTTNTPTPINTHTTYTNTFTTH